MIRPVARLSSIGILAVASLFTSTALLGQTGSLTLSSGSAALGGTIPLNLNWTAPGTNVPAGLQWTFSYTPGNIASITLAAGPALTAAGKVLNCNATNGTVICLATGINANTIGSGVIATVSVVLPLAISGSSVPISIGNPAAVLADGTNATLTGIGGTISVLQPLPSISSLLPSTALAAGLSFTLTVNGSGFTPASVVNWNGSARTTTFVSSTQLNATVTALDILLAILAQVTVSNPAPGGGTSGNAAFTITSTNPVPTISSLAPASATAGTAAFTLTVNGTGFLNGSAVRWNGNNRTTTFVSSTQLQAAITAADIAVAGTGQVTVFNPTPGGGTSANSPFTINASTPTNGTAAFVKTDTTTLGNWKGVYGADGYNIIGDTVAYPTYVTVTPSGNAAYTWASSTSDPRALLKVNSTTDRIASTWYSSGVMNVDLNFKDANSHQVALYIVDWDGLNSGRSQRVDILDGNNTQLDTRSLANFGGGVYLVWNFTGHVIIRITNTNAASNALLLGLLFGPGTANSPATFVKTDTTTLGNWKGVYGADGYNVIGDTVAYPTYVTVTPSGNAAYTWASSTSDPRALLKVNSTTDRIASTWYSSGVMNVDLNFKDANSHQVALYIVDWDGLNGGRTQRVDILDGNNTQLDTRSLANFSGGVYLVWNFTGHVIIRITNTNAASNALLLGLLFGPAGANNPPPPNNPVPAISSLSPANATAASAAFTLTVTGTGFLNGSVVRWNGASRTTTFVSSTQVQAAISAADIATAGTGQVTVFNPAPGGGTSSNSAFTITATNPAPTISSLSPASATAGTAAFTLTVNGTGFFNGSVVRWNGTSRTTTFVSSTQLQAAITAADIAVAGTGQVTVFNPAPGGGTSGNSAFTINPPVPANTAAFVKTDTTTRGNWKGAYGADGYNIIGDTVAYPTYVTVTPSGNSSYTWTTSTTDVRGLLKVNSTTDRIASTWYTPGVMNVDLNFKDANTHQVALYLADWDGTGGGRSQRVDILDANNTQLDTRSLASFSGGVYLVWNFTGHVIIRITNTNAASNALLFGLLFGPAAASNPATFVKTDTATRGNWKGVYGADGYNIVGDTVAYPTYVTVTPSGNVPFTWATSTTDPRALLKANSTTDRVASTWYATGAMTVDLNFKDGNTHQVALYTVDWDGFNGGRSQRVDILDANNTQLDTRSLASFSGGVYLVWNFTGHVIIRITNTNAASNALLFGLLFGPGVANNPTSTADLVQPDTTTPGMRKSAHGTDIHGAANTPHTLSCSPGTVNAGGIATCELRMPASLVPLQFQLSSNSTQIKLPPAVVSRSNQRSLTFQASIDATAKAELAVITATLGDSQAQDKIFVNAVDRPVLTTPGRHNAKFGERLAFLVTAIDPADLPVQLAASGIPPGASFDPASGRFVWTPSAAQEGTHRVTFTATNSARQSSTTQVIIGVDSGRPVLTPSDRFACSPGSAATLAGKWLASPGTVLSDASGNSLDLGGTKVKVNSQYVSVLFASETAVSFLCPILDPGTPVSVAVETAFAVTDAVTTTMQEAAPTIFSLDGSGENQGLISFVRSTDIAMSRTFRVPAHPAQPGDQILIWATGLGRIPEAIWGLSVKLGDLYAVVDSVEAVPGHAGIYAIQVRIPASTAFGDAVPVQLEVAGSSKSFKGNSVTVAVEELPHP